MRRAIKAEYLFRPGLALKRFYRRAPRRLPDGRYCVALPWGVSLEVGQLDKVTRAAHRLGVHDLVVTEAIFRLTKPGDTTIDVGANVGYMTVAMAARLRTHGRVIAFEPHPELFAELEANVARTRAAYPRVGLAAHAVALSDTTGVASLGVPASFRESRGVAAIGAEGDAVVVPTRQLDDDATELGPVALVKIDVEGHEAAVLRGAREMLRGGAVRHVIFEEHGRPPTEASSLLEDWGFTLFSLERELLRPHLGDARAARRSGWEAPSLLATRAPDEARAAFRWPGWRALGR